MDAAKRRLIQLILEIGHAAPQQMGSRSHVQAGVVVSSLNPINVGKFQKRDLGCALDRQTIHSRQIPAQRNSLFGAAECSLETRIVEGLEKIIQRSGLNSYK